VHLLGESVTITNKEQSKPQNWQAGADFIVPLGTCGYAGADLTG